MRTIFSLIALLLYTATNAQTSKPTGGCEYTGAINHINPFTATYDSILINGHSYSVDVELGALMQICSGSMIIKLGNLQVGNMGGNDGFYTIPLDVFNVPPGPYLLYFTFMGDTLATKKVTVPGILPVPTISRAGFAIYPVPAKDVLHIETGNSGEHITDIKIINCNGELMQALPPDGPVTQLSLTGLPCGMYIVKVQTTTAVYNNRITIVH